MEALGLNLGFFLAQFLNFGLFALFMGFVAWKPLLKMLDDRSEKIAKGLEDARVAEEARANAEAEAKKIMDKARGEAQAIIAEARANAEERAKPILTAAQEEADKVRTDAQARAEEARNAALSEVRGQVVALAIAAANQLIGKSMDEKHQQKIVNDFFSTSQKDIKGLGGEVVVTTALPLSADEQKSLEKSLGAKVTGWKVDPSILGGVVVRSGDRVLDGSVRASLQGLAVNLN